MNAHNIDIYSCIYSAQIRSFHQQTNKNKIPKKKYNDISIFHRIVKEATELSSMNFSHGNFFLNIGRSVIAFTICMLRWYEKQRLMNQCVRFARSLSWKSVDLWIYELDFYCHQLIISSRDVDDDGLATAQFYNNFSFLSFFLCIVRCYCSLFLFK